MARFRAIGRWLEERAGLGAILAVPLSHRVPRTTASWAYVFGSATLILFVLQIATGICLALVYNEWPMPGRLVDRATYRKRYEEEVAKDGVPFFPVAARKDMVGMGVVVLAVLFCAAIFGPSGPHGVPDPTIIDTVPKPDFYFLALFALFALLPPWTETAILLIGPPLAIGFLLLVPFLAGTGEKSWRRRPVAVLGVLLIVLTAVTLASLGLAVPWSPVMDAWSGTPTPAHYVRGRTPLELQGALVLQNKQCRNCHSLGGGEAGEAPPSTGSPRA